MKKDEKDVVKDSIYILADAVTQLLYEVNYLRRSLGLKHSDKIQELEDECKSIDNRLSYYD